MQIKATSFTVCFGVRCTNSSRSRNVFDRARELDTAAATPNSTSSVIRISDVDTGFTPQVYVVNTAQRSRTP